MVEARSSLAADVDASFPVAEPPAGGMLSRTIAVVSAGVHEPSNTTALAVRLAAAVAAAAQRHGVDTVSRRVEIRDVAGDLALASVGGEISAALSDAMQTVTGADALIAVTPVFAASYAGLFKSFFDVLDPDSLDGKPAIVAATGGSARHSLVIDHALRPLLSYFRAVVMPTGVFVAPADSDDALRAARVEARVARAGAELAAALALLPTPGGRLIGWVR
jgi:FMN reductase